MRIPYAYWNLQSSTKQDHIRVQKSGSLLHWWTTLSGGAGGREVEEKGGLRSKLRGSWDMTPHCATLIAVRALKRVNPLSSLLSFLPMLNTSSEEAFISRWYFLCYWNSWLKVRCSYLNLHCSHTVKSWDSMLTTYFQPCFLWNPVVINCKFII